MDDLKNIVKKERKAFAAEARKQKFGSEKAEQAGILAISTDAFPMPPEPTDAGNVRKL